MITKKSLDEIFIETMLKIENSYFYLSKHEKIRIELWTKKLSLTTINPIWKQIRNDYATILLKMVLKGNLNEPFNKGPPEGPLPNLLILVL